MSKELSKMSIEELAPLIASKEISPTELTKSVLEQAISHNPKINAFIRIDEENALLAASKAESEIAEGNYLGPLHGIPMALKDIFFLDGQVSTMGSKIHKDFAADYDATVVSKLKQAGAILIGTLNMHEYAWGGTTNNPHFGPCRNPWNTERIPGGSSGGSGAAVAADMSIASLGTDTAGSIRIPSAACGIVGLKPTHGRVSKHGCFPLSWSLDHVGPMTKTVTDAAIMLEAIAGYDPNDPTTINVPVQKYTQFLKEDIKGLVIGVEENYYFQDIDEEVSARVREGIETLRALGAEIKPVSVPALKHTLFAEYVTILGESGAIHHNNMKERPLDFGEDVRISLGLAEMPSAVDYVMGQQIRRKLVQDFNEVFQSVDVIIAPTLPIVAPKIGEETTLVNGKPSMVTNDLIRLNSPSNLSGLPSLSIPCGLSKGLPVGMQIIGKAFDESTLLKVGFAFEQTKPMGNQKPQLGEAVK
ncbi:Asp-tRNA(Asn)/Glu-tRNA(Gln) amidotransferase GatCAB subunit A [Domibacillus epiphyticus]|uniref:Amidase n=1 Tax=Domibacillus epiphyticus TaxID=1714355 RepID=A0A1V2ACQ8_9BACI|nr:Asp-tRNA(Asn)/Glu-tRNA(Gln) amidotransferase GatCAB subunit A [Domibacillus epiphyticus]OMP68740.1 amidase [Domibacillus epiphyticus]